MSLLRARIRSKEAVRVDRGIVPALAAARRASYAAPDVDSGPLTRIKSVPAIAARIARSEGETPRAAAVPVSESVIVTPRKPSVPRSRVSEIARDQPAPLFGSYAS